MNNYPFFSIIVVSLNAANSIKETIDSILIQNFEDYEVIVKDGQSVDDTLKNIPNNPRISVHISSDAGIYDAMNQALALARGKYINFLNCGDCYANPEVLRSVYDSAKNFLEPRVIYGNMRVDEGVCVQERKLGEFSLFRRPLNHQSCFVESSLFEKFGNFDMDYRILADYEFTMRTWFGGTPYFHIDKLFINYLGFGFSVSTNNLRRKNYELRKLRLKYFSSLKRCLYNIAIMFSFVHIRLAINSPYCPQFIKRAYRLTVSFIIEKINWLQTKVVG